MIQDPKQVLSLGGGVQSSTLALMAAHGEVGPMPAAAIFADTGAEPSSVYSWLAWLEEELPFPVLRVSAGDLREKALAMRRTADGRAYAQTAIPCFTLNEDGSQGRITHRSCTRDFKIRPILKKLREICQVPRACKTVRAVQWIGISLDEVVRMKPARDRWAVNRWPLIEQRMTRHDCLRWMESHGYPRPPRSACVFCPFHSDHEWRRLRDEEPAEFASAVDFERRLQAGKAESPNFRSRAFLHRSLAPLDAVDLSTDEEQGQGLLWGNECCGVCGV